MFVRWKRRKLRREDQPVWIHPETGEEVDAPRRGSYDVMGGTLSNPRRIYVRNIGWTRGVRLAGGIPAEVQTKPAPDVYTLDAVLVESVRIDGKPRQRYIAYLATIREDDLTPDADPRWRVQFWRTVDKRLAELDLGDGDRARIVATLEDRVPRLTAEQYEAELDRIAREARMLRTIMGGV